MKNSLFLIPPLVLLMLLSGISCTPIPPKPKPKKVVAIRGRPPHPHALWVKGQWKWSRRHQKWIWIKGHWKGRRARRRPKR